jgi:hypothetical protein
MKWVFLLAAFGAGFGIGAWRAGVEKRSILSAAALLPLIVVIGTGGLVGYLLYGAANGDSFAGLAAASVTVLGLILSLLALFGGLFGAWYRRAGERRP